MIERLALVLHWVGFVCLSFAAVFGVILQSLTNTEFLFIIIDNGSCLGLFSLFSLVTNPFCRGKRNTLGICKKGCMLQKMRVSL